MLRIRLRRVGKKKKPSYQIVVAESSRSRDGKFIEKIGFYDPLTEPATIRVDQELAKQWMGHGAQLSETVEQLFVKVGIIKEIKKGSTPPKKRPKKKENNEQEKES